MPYPVGKLRRPFRPQPGTNAEAVGDGGGHPVKREIICGPSRGHGREPEKNSSDDRERDRHRRERVEHAKAMFRGRRGQKRMSTNRVEKSVDGDRCRHGSEEIAAGYREWR